MIVTYLCKCGHKFEAMLGQCNQMVCPKCRNGDDKPNVEFDEVPEIIGDNDNEQQP